MFAGLVEAEGIRRGAHHVRQTILGDGAPWIWNIAAAKFPEATQVVDLFHAREHLHELAGILEFMLGDQRKDWLAARLDDLATATSTASAPPELIPLSAARKTTWAGRWATSKPSPRMRYKWFRSRGGQQPVGSHLHAAPHSDRRRLTSLIPKMIMIPDETGAHPP